MSDPGEGRGRRLEVPTDHADDDGVPDPDLVAAVEAWSRGAGSVEEVYAALRGARLLVPVVAVLDEAAPSGEEKSSHMATVSLVQSDGRRGLLAFTGLPALLAWDPRARPVPAAATRVAAAAIDEGAAGVIVDIAGPVTFAVDGPALSALARPAP